MWFQTEISFAFCSDWQALQRFLDILNPPPPPKVSTGCLGWVQTISGLGGVREVHGYAFDIVRTKPRPKPSMRSIKPGTV